MAWGTGSVDETWKRCVANCLALTSERETILPLPEDQFRSVQGAEEKAKHSHAMPSFAFHTHAFPEQSQIFLSSEETAQQLFSS